MSFSPISTDLLAFNYLHIIHEGLAHWPFAQVKASLVPCVVHDLLFEAECGVTPADVSFA